MKEDRHLRDAKAAKAAIKRKKRRRKRTLFLLSEIFVLIILLGIGYVMRNYEKFQRSSFGENEIEMNQGVKKEGYTTIALFGGDSREGVLEKGTHADTIMIVAINDDTKEVKIVSVFRDTITKQENGKLKKANNAYFESGPKEAINLLNRNFDLDIQDYVTVDFKALADVIDLLGGIEIDVTEEEAKEVNNYIDETAGVVGKKSKRLKGGLQTLDGIQAVTYARIRKNVGGDYKRTERQRLVIQKMVEQAKTSNLATISKIINQVFPQISTSFSLKELLGLAASGMQYQLGETRGFPFEYTDGKVEGVGSVVIPLGHVENVEELHEFLYSKEEYSVSEKVENIAKEIEEATGIDRGNVRIQ